MNLYHKLQSKYVLLLILELLLFYTVLLALKVFYIMLYILQNWGREWGGS